MFALPLPPPVPPERPEPAGPATDDDQPLWLAGLNDAQRAAVEHEGGPMLVVAGAGSGKTRTLAARVARLLSRGADPDRVLLLTFSRRAAREMLRRAEHLGAARRSAGRVWGGTFHAIGHRLLRQHGRAVGLPPSFSILDRADASDLMGVVRSELGLGEQGRRFPKKDTLLDIYSRVANAGERLSDTLGERFPWCAPEADGIRAAFEGYAARKRDRALLDYDDLLLYWRALVTSSPAAAMLQRRFDHVLIDEYQDTNVLQADIVAGLSVDGDGVFVVGDDAQAIYGFRAASAANMAGFTERFPGARVVTLDANYRSTQPILDVANAVMSSARGVFPKQLHAARAGVVELRNRGRPLLAKAAEEGAEALFVCDRVLEHREEGVALREQAVLFRSGNHSARLEMELARLRIPFVKYGGITYLEAAHVKDVLAFLRLLDNPSDELAWHRVLALAGGVGPQTIRRVLEQLALPNPEAVVTFASETSPITVPARAAEGVGVLRSLFRACLDAAALGRGPASDVDLLRTRAAALFERRYDDGAARLQDLEQLQAMATGYTTRAEFLAELTIDPPSRTTDFAGPPMLDDDYLILSTIHSAKGGEWTAVYVIHASDGNLPSDMALTTSEGLEEERRLLYVAVTRARDHLYVVHPMRYYDRRHGLDDVHALAQPSRFIAPLTSLFDEPPPEVSTALLTDRSTPAGPDNVGAALAALWS